MKSVRFIVVAAGLTCSALVAAQSASAPDVQLKAAENRELVDRDVNGAMQQYQRIAQTFAGDHVVAAEALLHLGRIYERLGRPEARETYQEIVSAYPDVSAVVDAARTRLSALQDAAAGPFTVKVFDDSIRDAVEVVPSPDGRYLAYRRDGSPDGPWYLRDLTSGKESVLVSVKAPEVLWGPLTWATDSRHATFTVFESQDGLDRRHDVFDRRIVSIPDRQVRSIGTVTLQPNDANWAAVRTWAQSFVWSPDGKRLAFIAREGSGSYDVHVFTLASGGDLNAGPFSVSGNVVWSLDSQRMAFLTAGAKQSESIRVVTPSTGAASELSVPAAGAGQRSVLLGWTPTNEIYFRQSVTGGNDFFLVDAAGGAVRKICEGRAPSGGDGCGSGLSPDGTLQIIQRNGSGGGRTVLRKIADGAERALTPEAVWEQSAVRGFSPDGRLFAFKAHRDGAYGLYVVPVDRIPLPNPVKVASLTSQTTVVDGVWTSSGLVLGLRDSQKNLYRIDVDPRTRRPTGAPIRLTQNSPVNDEPSISGDSQRIAYTSRVPSGLAVMQANGAGERLVKEVPSEMLTRMLIAGWQSADDVLVLAKLGAGDPRSTPSSQGVLNVSTGDLRYQATPLDAAGGWSFLPASRMLVHSEAGSGKLVLQSISGGPGRTIPLPDDWSDFTFSPDARWLAYSTVDLPGDRSKPAPGDIRLRALDTGAERVLAKWANTNDNENVPLAFSPEGRFLVYQDPSDALKVMDVATTESWPLLVDPPAGVDFVWPDVEWSPDGKFLIVTGNSFAQTWRRYDGVTYDAVTKLVIGKK